MASMRARLASSSGTSPRSASAAAAGGGQAERAVDDDGDTDPDRGDEERVRLAHAPSGPADHVQEEERDGEARAHAAEKRAGREAEPAALEELSHRRSMVAAVA